MPTVLLIPDFLYDYKAVGSPRLPKLERMLARAARQKPRHVQEILAGLFGLDTQALQPGPFMHLGEGGLPEGYWLRADPVHLAPDRDQLVLMPGSILEPSHQELQDLAEAFNSRYEAEGWHLEFPHQDRGYLRAPRALDVFTHDPEPFVGGEVFEAMPTGPDSKLLKQLMNETQMLFYTHTVNAAREEANRPTINSLWLWGGGQLPPNTPVAPARVYGDLPLIVGLARWADLEINPPNRNTVWEEGDLCVLGKSDPNTLDRDWFGPLLEGLKQGNLSKLHLHLGGIGDFTLDTAGSQRFWRRGRPLSVP